MTIIISLLMAIASGRNNSICPLRLNALYQWVRIVRFIGDYPFRFKVRNQCQSLSNIGYLTGAQKPTHGISQCVYSRVNFARQSASGTPYGLFLSFF